MKPPDDEAVCRSHSNRSVVPTEVEIWPR